MDKSENESIPNNLPPDFEPIKYEDPKKENAIFEVFKSQEWETIVPQIIEAIDYCKEDQSFGDYPYFRIQNTIQFLPQTDVPSEIFNETQLKELHSRLPYYHQYSNLRLVYSIGKDGCLLKSFYQKVSGENNIIIVVKDDDNNVFGAYASEEFTPSGKFFGTGECFLFTFYKENRIHVYNASGVNEHYLYADDKQIAFGCSDDYFSLTLENDFYGGYSKPTQTYKNPVLNGKDKFIIIKLEVWCFQNK